jgi:hypothetical protein
MKGRLKEQTVYAVFRRDREGSKSPQERHFKQNTEDKGKGAQYVLSDRYAWVFVYGISMDEQHLKNEFAERGINDFDDIIIGSQAAFLQNAKLSWCNYSKKYNAVTATFDDAPEEQLSGVAYLVTPEGLEGFERRQRPAYERLPEQRDVVLAESHRTVKAWVFNVEKSRRKTYDLIFNPEYIKTMKAGARSHGLDASYIPDIQSGD